MSDFTCGFARHLDDFVAYRIASGRWCASGAKYLRAFDRHCTAANPDADELTQEMIDSWCSRRETESAASCRSRCGIARRFAAWAFGRGLTDAVLPDMPRGASQPYVPHAFTKEELARFFAACDSDVAGNKRREICKVQCAAFFRLLYSSGVRTIEARHLKRCDVDLEDGVLNVRKSKGGDQHYVALHPTMAEVLRAYDAAAERLQPGREWFFQSSKGGGHLGCSWVDWNFARLWRAAGGEAGAAVAYDLRHQYAVENILSWDCDAFEAHDRLLWLSKSMGHRHLSSTLYYFSVTPALADKLLALTGDDMDRILPVEWEAEDGEA